MFGFKLINPSTNVDFFPQSQWRMAVFCLVNAQYCVINSTADKNKFVESETFAVITIFRSVNNSAGG